MVPNLAALVLGASSAAAQPPDSLCVQNASDRAHLFAAEAPGASRKLAMLSPGDKLCITGATAGTQGRVWVYETPDSLEGCGRLVPVGQAEEMRRFVEFDRCFWSSNS